MTILFFVIVGFCILIVNYLKAGIVYVNACFAVCDIFMI